MLYTHKITLKNSLNIKLVIVNHLDGKVLNISMDEIISPDEVKIVKNEGIQIIDEGKLIESLVLDNKKPDLYIKFEI